MILRERTSPVPGCRAVDVMRRTGIKIVFMVILEQPYVSDMLVGFLRDNGIPVLDNDFVRSSGLSGLNLKPSAELVGQYSRTKKIYTVSEHALNWVNSVLNDAELNRQITIMKDKAAFREACRDLYPGFFFKEVTYNELFAVDVAGLKFPFVIKPSVGFLSVGVFTIFDEKDWTDALASLERDFKAQAAKFPGVVIGDNKFLLESYIDGKELAVDIYFRDGEPVIVNIFEHPFSSGKDVSDRLYFTSKEIFDRYLEPLTEYFSKLNKALKLDHVPVHAEIRVDGDGFIPIEINPLRFTGMCLNDLHYYIAGKHPLYYYFNDAVPDYAGMWKGKEDVVFSFSILERTANAFDRKAIEPLYSNVLEWRTLRNPNLDLEAFVFSQTRDAGELDKILTLKL